MLKIGRPKNQPAGQQDWVAEVETMRAVVTACIRERIARLRGQLVPAAAESQQAVDLGTGADPIFG